MSEVKKIREIILEIAVSKKNMGIALLCNGIIEKKDNERYKDI